MGVNKSNILKAIFKSKDGASWNEVSEYLNEFAKDLLMELYENDMIEPHKNFMCGEDINTIEDGILKLINWYESEGSKFEQRKAALPLHDVMRSCLLAIADGRVRCDMDYPNYGKIKVEIIGVNLTNIKWKPINVRILDKELKKEVERLEEYDGFGSDFEKPTHLVKHKEAYTEDWVDVRWLSNYA